MMNVLYIFIIVKCVCLWMFVHQAGRIDVYTINRSSSKLDRSSWLNYILDLQINIREKRSSIKNGQSRDTTKLGTRYRTKKNKTKTDLNT
jgi:hypothetical protein